MWSFHDDIKRNLKRAIEQLESEGFDLKIFNRLVGDFFFNVYAIKFREERILYPLAEEVIPAEILNSLFKESLEIGFPFYTPVFVPDNEQKDESEENRIDLETGN
jgi:DUF438 domain-containing protein